MNQLTLLPVEPTPLLTAAGVGDYIEATTETGDRVRGEVVQIHQGYPDAFMPATYWLKVKIADREISPITVLQKGAVVILPAQNKSYTQWTGEYSKRVRGQLLWYCRYYWMDGSRTRHAHIPGGNASSAKALHHRSEVERMIAEGKGPIEITKYLRLLSQGRGWNLNRLPTGSVGRKEEHIP
jgi:hypothetical protein